MGIITDVVFGWLGKGEKTKAEKNAINASQDATDKSINFLRESRDLTRVDNQPWQQAGTAAVGRLNAMSTDPNSFTADPGYQWRMQQGINAVDRSAASQGRLNSGGTMKALTRYGQGFGSNEFSNVWNRQAGLAGVGQTANAANSAAGQNFANNASNALAGNAANRISGYRNMGQARSDFWGSTAGSINSGANMFAQMMMGGM